ncbi:MAG: chloride channel protein, partial [Anaerolineae bacterium]|nr:chloride channel protein [Anaerolineae bacterium]
MNQENIGRIRRYIEGWLDRAHIPEPIIISLAAVVVGLVSGILVWLFKLLINESHNFMFDFLGKFLEMAGHWTIIFIPVLGGLVVGGLGYYFIGRERYHGMPGIIEACALAGGKLPYSKLPVKILAASISIGSGASVGPEDPSVQIGTNIGSMFGQWMRLPEERTRALVAGGAAAGIAAAFNAPIAGVFFALEVLLGELSSTSFAFAAISAVISSIFTQAVAGNQPAFIVPQYSFNSAWELPLYLALGILAGPLAAAYIFLITWFRKLFHDFNAPDWSKPAIAGLGVGLVGVFYPQLFGVGYDTIGSVLTSSSRPALFLLFLLVAKLILTPLIIGGGFVGGVFAPSLFLGAMLGGAFGVTASQLFPALNISAPAFAMVGMAAVLAGTVHAPLTAILLLFEMTHDYRIILPLMFAVAVSLAISHKLQKDSIYRLPLAQNGIRTEGG